MFDDPGSFAREDWNDAAMEKLARRDVWGFDTRNTDLFLVATQSG